MSEPWTASRHWEERQVKREQNVVGIDLDGTSHVDGLGGTAQLASVP